MMCSYESCLTHGNLDLLKLLWNKNPKQSFRLTLMINFYFKQKILGQGRGRWTVSQNLLLVHLVSNSAIPTFKYIFPGSASHQSLYQCALMEGFVYYKHFVRLKCVMQFQVWLLFQALSQLRCRHKWETALRSFLSLFFGTWFSICWMPLTESLEQPRFMKSFK